MMTLAEEPIAARVRPLSPQFHQVSNVGIERYGNPLENEHGGVALSPLDPAEISLVNISPLREFFLGIALRAAQPLHIQADSHPHIHREDGGRNPSLAP
jgi:hypothetical protein